MRQVLKLCRPESDKQVPGVADVEAGPLHAFYSLFLFGNVPFALGHVPFGFRKMP
ncbi:hypothetical protein [Bradyrhizobium ottawaense]|uniref:hypothetical protein n=1 Tax=Bradyrhizobium ottawaense TaxID=931866 RepID=UPI003FA147B2